eukprot:scaffold4768_cov412-Prasinococcus_capsulatus_cf.AAC.28
MSSRASCLRLRAFSRSDGRAPSPVCGSGLAPILAALSSASDCAAGTWVEGGAGRSATPAGGRASGWLMTRSELDGLETGVASMGLGRPVPGDGGKRALPRGLDGLGLGGAPKTIFPMATLSAPASAASDTPLAFASSADLILIENLLLIVLSPLFSSSSSEDQEAAFAFILSSQSSSSASCLGSVSWPQSPDTIVGSAASSPVLGNAGSSRVSVRTAVDEGTNGGLGIADVSASLDPLIPL